MEIPSSPAVAGSETAAIADLSNAADGYNGWKAIAWRHTKSSRHEKKAP